MDVQKELEKWMNDHHEATTDEQLADHVVRFKTFLASLTPEEGRAFAKAYNEKAKRVKADARVLIKTLNVKKELERVQDFISMSYIAEHYFGKTRHWLYQRINGNIVNGKPVDFTTQELDTLSQALSDMGAMLNETSRSIARP